MKKNALAIATAAPISFVRPSQSPRGLWITLAAIVGVFGPSLYKLGVFALGSDLYSYIVLIPAISLHSFWLTRNNPVAPARPNRRFAVALLGLGVAALATDLLIHLSGAAVEIDDRLAITTVGFVASVAGGCAWFLGRPALRALAFPLGFLLFMSPLPVLWLATIETFMQHGSAAVAQLMFQAAGTTVFSENLTFQLPGISLRVAPECSGIRSTLVLLIVSVITGRFFLRSPVARTALALTVVPLALVRNGFRIFIVGELCTHYGAQMIDSFIHRRGGPIFFALSLVPFFLIVVLLQRREQRAAR